jgi:hypothetical protein
MQRARLHFYAYYFCSDQLMSEFICAECGWEGTKEDGRSVNQSKLPEGWKPKYKTKASW